MQKLRDYFTLTDQELVEYWGLVGMQMQCANEGDLHKVALMQKELMYMISRLANKKVKMLTGREADVTFSPAAERKYNLMCYAAIRQGCGEDFPEWVEKQKEVEGWVCRFIEGAVVEVWCRMCSVKKK